MTLKSLIYTPLFAAAFAFPSSTRAQELEIDQLPSPPPVSVGELPRTATSTATGPSGIISNVAGTGHAGSSGNSGPAIHAELYGPQGVVVDSHGNLYIADSFSNSVRRVIASTGIIDAFAGTGVSGYSGDNGPAIDAQLNFPSALAIDSKDNLFISDEDNSVIRRVDAETGKITTVAGDGLPISPITGLVDCGPLPKGGPATKSSICYPLAVAVDADDNLYISDFALYVYRVDGKTGEMTTIAGNGNDFFAGDGGPGNVGPANESPVGEVYGIAVDKSGNVFLGGNCTIRRIDAKTHVITSVINSNSPNAFQCGYSQDGTLASQSMANSVNGIVVDSNGDIYYADLGLIRVIEADNGRIYTVAGNYPQEINGGQESTPAFSGDGGPARGAFFSDDSIAFDSSGNLYIDDYLDNVIRKVTGAKVSPESAPAISLVSGDIPVGGIIDFPAEIVLTPAKAGETVYYTTNGSVPTTSSPKYAGPFRISNTSIIQAFSPGSPNSPAAVSFLFDAPTPVLHVPENKDGTPVGTKFTITDENPHAVIAYEINKNPYPYPGENPAMTKYTGPVELPVGSDLINAYAWTSAKDFSGRIIGIWSNPGSANVVISPAPTVTTKPATSNFSSAATLNGTIAVSVSGQVSVPYRFVWGPQSNPTANVTTLQNADSSLTLPASAFYFLNGLSPSTTYVFRFEAQDATTYPNFVDGKTLTFTTPAQ
jgi:sugar lactone lactonase YvrE